MTTTTAEKPSTELALPEVTSATAPEVYVKGGLSPFIQRVKEQVEGEIPDVTTKKGRARVASLAMQVARSKTAIEKPGREYLKHLKALPKVVETELREFTRGMDALRDEVRAPLNEWEAAEQARVNEHTQLLDCLRGWYKPELNYDSSQIEYEIKRVTGIDTDTAEEYAEQCAMAKAATLKRFDEALVVVKAAEEQQAELDKLRAEAARREQAERERTIAIEATAKAKAEAELAVQSERDAAAKREVEHKAHVEQAKRDAAAAAEFAEQQVVNARRQAEQQAAAAQQRAEQEKQQAIEAERKRYEAEQQAAREAERIAAEAAAAKAANVEHRRVINNAALFSLMTSADLTEAQAQAVIKAVAKGEVANITINY